MFVEEMLRVSDVPGTLVLMLALGYALGSIVEFAVGLRYFVRDFKLPLTGLGRLMFEIFAASVLGSGVSYVLLAVLGKLVDINTTLGIMVQGGTAGVFGLAMTAYVLTILGNTEFAEAVSAVMRRFSPSRTTLEPSDIAST
jgi:energy-converting hydrogenase Eha subunit A